MNQQQKKYLAQRIENIFHSKNIRTSKRVKELASYNWSSTSVLKELLDCVPLMSYNGFIQLIKDHIEKGDVQIKIQEFFNQKLLNKENEKRKKTNEKINKEYSRKSEKLRNKKTEIIDKIYFGSDEEALKLLEEFEKFEV